MRWVPLLALPFYSKIFRDVKGSPHNVWDCCWLQTGTFHWLTSFLKLTTFIFEQTVITIASNHWLDRLGPLTSPPCITVCGSGEEEMETETKIWMVSESNGRSTDDHFACGIFSQGYFHEMTGWSLSTSFSAFLAPPSPGPPCPVPIFSSSTSSLEALLLCPVQLGTSLLSSLFL